MYSRKVFFSGVLIAIIVAALDQLSKYFLLQKFHIPGDGIPVTSYFNIVLVWNRGISFGLFNNYAASKYIFGFVAIVISIALLFWLRKAEDRLQGTAIGLVIGGAIGNLVDRIILGSVVDFLDFHLGPYHWPAFNIADSAICVGAIILAICVLLAGEEKGKK